MWVRYLASSLLGYTGQSANGVFRPLEPFLLLLADLYLSVHENQPCLHWFKENVNTFYVTVEADCCFVAYVVLSRLLYLAFSAK